MHMKVFKRFSFEGAHRLPDWPEVHGHSYQVEVWFEGPVVDGYVVPEAELTALTERVRQQLDHKFLNNILPTPTSENIAKFIWDQFSASGMIERVRVYRESCSMGVEYAGELREPKGFC